MPPPGGLTDKIGNRYEGRVAVWRVLRLIDDLHDSVRFRLETPGDDHFEWWVQRADGSRTYTQVKRQQAPDEDWSIRTLASKKVKVLTAFGDRLETEATARCEFFSALSASHLQDLAESALMAADLQEFEAVFAASQIKQDSWQETSAPGRALLVSKRGGGCGGSASAPSTSAACGIPCVRSHVRSSPDHPMM